MSVFPCRVVWCSLLSKKEKKHKKKKKVFKVRGKKEYSALFEGTGLDKDAKVRRRVSKLAKRALKKRSKGSSSTDSDESMGELGEEGFSKRAPGHSSQQKAGPGALAYHALRQMRRQMLQTMGHQDDESAILQPVGLNFIDKLEFSALV